MGIELSGMILGHVIQMKAEASPDKECVIFERNKNPDVHLTYGDMWRNSNKIAAVLKKEGVEKKPAPDKTKGAAAKKTKPAQDYQLSRAIDLLRGIALFKSRAVN